MSGLYSSEWPREYLEKVLSTATIHVPIIATVAKGPKRVAFCEAIMIFSHSVHLHIFSDPVTVLVSAQSQPQGWKLGLTTWQLIGSV